MKPETLKTHLPCTKGLHKSTLEKWAILHQVIVERGQLSRDNLIFAYMAFEKSGIKVNYSSIGTLLSRMAEAKIIECHKFTRCPIMKGLLRGGRINIYTLPNMQPNLSTIYTYYDYPY